MLTLVTSAIPDTPLPGGYARESGNTELIPAQAPAGFHPPNSQPVLRCKCRSQLPRNRTPVRPRLHTLPYGYGEGDLNAIADGTNPSAWDALGATKQASGQHQGRSLMYRQPISLHKLHPADDGTVGRVDLIDLHSLPVATGNAICLDLTDS